MAPAALAAGVGGALGALALPYAPRALLSLALPFVLVAVALYFAVSPALGEGERRRRVSPMIYVSALAPAIGFYDGVFGPGAGSFYLIALVALVGLSLIPAMAAGRLSNFGSNVGALIRLRPRRAYRRSGGTGDGRRRLPWRAPGRAFGDQGGSEACAAPHYRGQLRDGAEAHGRAWRTARFPLEVSGWRLTPRARPAYKPARARLGLKPGPFIFERRRSVRRRERKSMANTKSAQKAARQTIRRTEVNKSRRSEMRTYVRKVEEAIASKDPKVAAEALSAAEPRLARAAQKGIVHKNAASRKISRLTKRVKALAV